MGGSRLDNRIRSHLTARFGTYDIDQIGFTENISASGILLKAARLFPVETQLKIELLTDGNQDIRFVGIVRSSKRVRSNLVSSDIDAGMGIEILRFFSGQAYYDRLLTKH